jgi:hypothetical protein
MQESPTIPDSKESPTIPESQVPSRSGVDSLESNHVDKKEMEQLVAADTLNHKDRFLQGWRRHVVTLG